MSIPDLSGLVDGGAPRLGEPLPIELVNTRFQFRGRPRDGLDVPEHLAAWLRDARPRLDTPLADHDLLAVGQAELAAARALRDCLRALAEAAIDRRRPDQAHLDALNRQVHAAARWRELGWTDGPFTRNRVDGPPVTAALAEIAQAGVDLLAGAERAELRSCQGPGCVLLFVRDHPRREWCSAGCGNRARAARHYSRVRRRRDPNSASTTRTTRDTGNPDAGSAPAVGH